MQEPKHLRQLLPAPAEDHLHDQQDEDAQRVEDPLTTDARYEREQEQQQATEHAKAVLRRAVELGVNFIDTAASYGPEINERQLSDALHPYPEDLLIATKGGLIHERQGEWIRDGRPENLRASCEASLSRLRVDRIDLYQLHSVDPSVPFEDS